MEGILCRYGHLSHASQTNLDMHDVVDTLTWTEAIDVGLAIDYSDKINGFLCSYGKDHRHEAFDRSMPFSPLINDLDGYIWPDYRQRWHDCIDVYRKPWMPFRAICIRGDNGQVAQLTGMPCLLLDDEAANINLLTGRSSMTAKLNGAVVCIGRKAHRRAPRGYACVSIADQIIDPVQHYNRRFGPAYSSDESADGPSKCSAPNVCTWGHHGAVLRNNWIALAVGQHTKGGAQKLHCGRTHEVQGEYAQDATVLLFVPACHACGTRTLLVTLCDSPCCIKVCVSRHGSLPNHAVSSVMTVQRHPRRHSSLCSCRSTPLPSLMTAGIQVWRVPACLQYQGMETLLQAVEGLGCLPSLARVRRLRTIVGSPRRSQASIARCRLMPAWAQT